jgi:hypothetical protein
VMPENICSESPPSSTYFGEAMQTLRPDGAYNVLLVVPYMKQAAGRLPVSHPKMMRVRGATSMFHRARENNRTL